MVLVIDSLVSEFMQDNFMKDELSKLLEHDSLKYKVMGR